jgi:hypothetical protein
MKTCDKCNRRMPDGALAYDIRIEVMADFDGALAPPEEAGDAAAQRREILQAAEEADPDTLMDDVYHAERHLLCPACRERFLANPLNLPLPETLP